MFPPTLCWAAIRGLPREPQSSSFLGRGAGADRAAARVSPRLYRLVIQPEANEELAEAIYWYESHERGLGPCLGGSVPRLCARSRARLGCCRRCGGLGACPRAWVYRREQRRRLPRAQPIARTPAQGGVDTPGQLLDDGRSRSAPRTPAPHSGVRHPPGHCVSGSRVKSSPPNHRVWTPPARAAGESRGCGGGGDRLQSYIRPRSVERCAPGHHGIRTPGVGRMT